MSAWMVNREHIDALVSLALAGPNDKGAVIPSNVWHGPSWWRECEPREVWAGHPEYGSTTRQFVKLCCAGLAELRKSRDEITANELGELLIRENLNSIHARYPDTIDAPEGTPGPCERYWENGYEFRPPAHALSAVEGLKALDCYEYQACEHSGWETSEAFRFCQSLRGSLVGHLPGYGDAPWGWDAENMAEAAQRDRMAPSERAELEACERAASDAEQAAYLRLFTD